MDDHQARFAAVFDAHYRAVLAYAVRRSDPDTAQEVAAETFLVAWRRFAEMPDEPRPWLLVVARNTLANGRRSDGRRKANELRAWQASELFAAPTSLADDVHERLDLLEALHRLTEADREVLMLIAWDGLTTAEAARVVGCTPTTFRVRLHRARSRLRAAVEPAPRHDRTPVTGELA